MSCNYTPPPQRQVQYGVPQQQSIRPLVRINGIADEMPQGYRIPATILPNLIANLVNNVLDLTFDSGDCSTSTQLTLPFITCEQVVDCMPQQTINNSLAPIAFPNGLIFQPNGPNNFNVVYDGQVFCQAVQACLPPQPVQTINNSLGPVTVAGITFTPNGQNNFDITFNLTDLCQAISTCLPPVSLQNVTGNLPSWLNAVGTGDDEIAFSFNEQAFCQAVQACLPSAGPETPITVITSPTITGSTSGASQHTLTLDVRVAPGANAIQVGPNGLVVNNCTIGTTIPSLSLMPASARVVVIDNGCLHSVPVQPLVLRDCNDAVIGSFYVIPA